MSAGANGESWQTIHGSDSLLDPTDEPAKDPNLQGGKRVNGSLGVTFNPPGGFFKGQQFLVQGDVPIMQSLDGPQLEEELHVARCLAVGFLTRKAGSTRIVTAQRKELYDEPDSGMDGWRNVDVDDHRRTGGRRAGRRD